MPWHRVFKVEAWHSCFFLSLLRHLLLGRGRTGSVCHVPAPRAVQLRLAPFSVTGFGAAGTEGTGRFQSQQKKRLGRSPSFLCLGFCPLCLQPSGVSFCESFLLAGLCGLLFVVCFLGVQRHENPGCPDAPLTRQRKVTSCRIPTRKAKRRLSQ